MSWANPIGDLRTLLSDGPNDKLRAFKQFMGNQNGVNTFFKTFEYRRINAFASATTIAPLGIYYNGNLLPTYRIVSDDLLSGYVQLGFPPSDADILLYTCYVQWFLDSELDGFLTRASYWLGQDDQYLNTPVGLVTAALKYAAHEAYQKLSLRYAEQTAEVFRSQDSPDPKSQEIVKAYQDASRNALKDAQTYRDDFYKNRKGQALAPISVSIRGSVRNPTIG